MTLRCAVCGDNLPEDDLAVCHHCGKPLCPRHRIRFEHDPAFVDPWFKVRWYQLPLLIWRLFKRLWPWRKTDEVIIAIHCQPCTDQFHAWVWY